MTPRQASHNSWYRQAAAVIPRHLILKSIGTTLFISLFFGAYFYLLKSPAYPTTVMPLTRLDLLIGFEPQTMPLYVSLWVYVSMPPGLAGDTARTPRLWHGNGCNLPGRSGHLLFLAHNCACSRYRLGAVSGRGIPEKHGCLRQCLPFTSCRHSDLFGALAASPAAPLWRSTLDSHRQWGVVFWHHLFHSRHAPACGGGRAGRSPARGAGRRSVIALSRASGGSGKSPPPRHLIQPNLRNLLT